MSPSPSEFQCRNAFDAALRAAMPTAELGWSNGSNPPDFFLTINGESHSVEVTKLMRTLTMGKKPMSMPAVVQHLADLVREAESRVREANLLRGTFVVHCPRPIEQLSSRREELVASIWTAVGYLMGQPEGSSEVFYRQRGRTFRVSKIRNEGAVLYLGGPTDSIWRGEAAIELRSLIEDRLAAKRQALRNVPTPWVLLLEEGYPYADSAMYGEVGALPTGVEEFAAIYVVRSQGTGVALWSRIPGLPGLW